MDRWTNRWMDGQMDRAVWSQLKIIFIINLENHVRHWIHYWSTDQVSALNHRSCHKHLSLQKMIPIVSSYFFSKLPMTNTSELAHNKTGKLKFFSTRPKWVVFYIAYIKFHSPSPVFHSPSQIVTRIGERASPSFPTGHKDGVWNIFWEPKVYIAYISVFMNTVTVGLNSTISVIIWNVGVKFLLSRSLV